MSCFHATFMIQFLTLHSFKNMTSETSVLPQTQSTNFF